MHLLNHSKRKALVLACASTVLATADISMANTVLEEVVVTAQKREQSVQDIGIAVTALTGDTLREMGIKETADLAAQIPAVDIRYSSGRTNPIVTIRGVGLNDNRPNNNPSAAVHIDEVYLGSSAFLSAQLFDVERVEVLKGPQGTLYGRNSTAGTINFVTTQPSQEFEAYLNTSYGNYDTLEIEGAIGGAITDVLSARLALDYQNSDGYVTNKGSSGYEGFSLHPAIPGQSFLGEDDKAASIDTLGWRGSLLFDPDNDFDVLVSVHGSRDRSGNDIWSTSEGGIQVSRDPRTAFEDTDGDDNDRYSSLRPEVSADAWGGMVKINYDFSAATLTSITAYESLDRFSSTGSGVPMNIVELRHDNELSQFTQELRLTSNNDSDFSWIAGAFYSDDEVDVSEDTSALGFFFSDIETAYTQTGESWAVFAHTEWQFTETLKLVTGLRYTEEEKTYKGGTTDLNPFGVSAILRGLTAPLTLVDTASDYQAEAWSGKIGLDWAVSEDVLVYGSISKGFKSGGIDGSTIFSEDDLTPFEAETVWAYEMGFKVDFAEGTSRLNGAVFLYDYEDMQAQATVVNATTGLPNTVRTNAGEAEIKGAELEWIWLPLEGLILKLGASFLDTEIVEWSSIDPAERALFEGNEVPDSPGFTYNGLIRYEWSLANEMQASVMTNFNYNDEIFKELENLPNLATDSYFLVNGRISLSSADDAWTLSLWGKNLTDKHYVTQTSEVRGGGHLELLGAPRTYGVSLNYRW